MIETDATIILFSDSQQKRASAYVRGDAPDVIALLSAAGMDDPAFGEMIMHAALIIADELEKREKQGAET